MTGQAHRSLEFFFFDAGGGHRSAATALKTVIAERYPLWNVNLVNLQNMLQPVDPIFRVTGHSSEAVYNKYLKTGLTYGSNAFLRGIQSGIRMNAGKVEKKLKEHWQRSNPDIVVSLIPNFNGVMFRALRQVQPQTPYVTVMTDLADSPPHFWQEKQNQFMICGSELATRQAHQTGYLPERVFQTSGMIIKPHFYLDKPVDRHAGRLALGLDPQLPTAIIMFGGYGSNVSLKIVKRLQQLNLQVQCIVMCGHNDQLKKTFDGKEKCHAVGFTDDVPHFMVLADFFIGKPGPGSISEAIHMGLPAIIECNHRTMIQERYNATWVKQNNLGLVVRSFNHISKAVQELIDHNHLEEFRANALSINNLAVFEIPEILNRIMADSAKSVVYELSKPRNASRTPRL